MYVNFLSTYSDKKSCHTSTTLQTSIARFQLSAIAELLVSCVAGFQTITRYNTIYNITRDISYPNVLFVAELESVETRQNNLSRSFFRTFANQPPVFTISFHFREIPLWSLDSRLRPTTPLPKPSLRTKKYCSFINFGLHHWNAFINKKTCQSHIITNQKSYSQPLHSAHPFHYAPTLCMLFVLIVIVFYDYFTCISFAIRPSGRKSAIKLIDWLIKPSFFTLHGWLLFAGVEFY